MVNTETHNSNKAIYCIATAAFSSTVVAFGGADRAWRLWDSRQSRKEDMVRSFGFYHTDISLSLHGNFLCNSSSLKKVLRLFADIP